MQEGPSQGTRFGGEDIKRRENDSFSMCSPHLQGLEVLSKVNEPPGDSLSKSPKEDLNLVESPHSSDTILRGSRIVKGLPQLFQLALLVVTQRHSLIRDVVGNPV